MRILIAGDTFPNDSNSHLFCELKAVELVGANFINLVRECDELICNLEGVLTLRGVAAKKTGPIISAAPQTVNGLCAIGVTSVSLANNHIMDKGAIGLRSTLNHLDAANIKYFGAGLGKESAKKPRIITHEGVRVGVYSCTENEFSSCTESRPGANGFDPLTSLDEIGELSAKVDFTIVIYHGGKERYEYPTPNLQKRCRRMIDKGANLVLCQHSHVIGCEEIFNHGTILYGQGNFLFKNSEDELTKYGLIIDLSINLKRFDIRYHLVEQTSKGVILSNNDNILEKMKNRSDRIKEPNFIEDHFDLYVKKNLDNYLVSLAGSNIVLKILNKISRGAFFKYFYSEMMLLRIGNIVECESHNEIVVHGCKKR